MLDRVVAELARRLPVRPGDPEVLKWIDEDRRAVCARALEIAGHRKGPFLWEFTLACVAELRCAMNARMCDRAALRHEHPHM